METCILPLYYFTFAGNIFQPDNMLEAVLSPSLNPLQKQPRFPVLVAQKEILINSRDGML